MRVEATVPDSRAHALEELTEALGLSRSQVIDEALSLFLKVVLEVRRGRRLVTLDPKNEHATCELVTPTLTALEWALQPEKLELPEKALAKMKDMIGSPAKPSSRLRSAAKRHQK